MGIFPCTYVTEKIRNPDAPCPLAPHVRLLASRAPRYWVFVGHAYSVMYTEKESLVGTAGPNRWDSSLQDSLIRSLETRE